MRTTVLGWLGAGILAAAWIGPLPEWSSHAFWAHMTLHMMVVAIAAPLIAMGIARGPWDPALSKPRLFAPIPASVLELVVVWAWHAPGLHHWARHHGVGMICEQGMFLASGLLVWISALGGLPSQRRTAAGIIALLLTSMHMTLLGALLALSPRPLYEHAVGHRMGGFSAIEDQNLGGAIMLVIGGISYLAGGVLLTAQLLMPGRTQRAGSVTSVPGPLTPGIAEQRPPT